LGHTNFKKVIELAQNDQLPGLDKKDLPLEGEIPGLDTCAACITGKSKHLPFKVGWERAVRPYEWVHVDFLGPMPEESAGRSKYIWLAVDNATQCTYISQQHAMQRQVLFSESTRQQWRQRVVGG
jgi:hypothetical protein